MRCPVCRAELAAGPSCRRCRADLTLLFDLEARRDRALDAARRSAARADWAEAGLHLAEVAAIRGGEDAERLAACVALATRDFDRAWRIYRRWKHDRDHSDRR